MWRATANRSALRTNGPGGELETDAIRARIEASILNLSPETEALKPKEISDRRFTVWSLKMRRCFARGSIVPLSGSAAAQENAALAAAAFNSQGARIEPGESAFVQSDRWYADGANPAITAAEEPAYGQNIVRRGRRRLPGVDRAVSAGAAGRTGNCRAERRRFIRSITVKSVRKPPFPIKGLDLSFDQ